MSNIKPSTTQKNEKNEPKKEDEIEHNSNMPIDTIKFRRKLSRINTKMRKIIEDIESTIPKNIGSIYDGKIIKVKATKNIGIADKMYENKNSEENGAYNVFANEDHVIKDLLLQFKEKNEKDKIPKLIRKRMAFNRLYNITDSSIEKLNHVKSRKKLFTLEEYQENILKAVNVNSVEQSEIMKLIESFNEIKIDSNNVTALPPINIEDYPAVKQHLMPYYDRLASRADKGDTPFNLRNCVYMNDFYKQKIVWGNLCLSSQFTLAEEGYFINAPSPMIVPGNKYILAVLNSKLGDWFIRQLGVTRNGGYFEYKPMFVQELPIPLISEVEQEPFCTLVDNILMLKKNNESTEELEQQIDDMVYSLYALTDEERAYIEVQKGSVS